VDTTAYAPLPTTVVDATHVAAHPTHFSIFQPVVSISSVGTSGGTSGGATSTGRGTSTGSTTRGTTGGRTSGKTGTGSSSGAGSASGGTGTGTTGGTSGGEPPDAGETDAGPDAGEIDAGPDAGETDAGPGDGGINSGGTATCSTNTDCIGDLGCMAIAIDSNSSGIASCNNPFLEASSVQGSIGNGGSFHPGGTPAVPAINTSTSFWTVEIDLPCCPASTGTMAVSAVVNWSAGGVNCNAAPKGTGTIDFTTVDADGGLAGTFATSVLAGLNGSFSFPSTLDGAFCDAGQPDLPPIPPDLADAGVDAGVADCSPDLDCLGPDGGTLTGAAGFWLDPSAAADGTWCTGPLDDLSASASIAGPILPTVTVVYESDFFELQAVLPCCPAGPGTLAAQSITLSSNVCGATPNVLSPMVASGAGTVTFTQTDGGLVGSIHLDGATEADATFSIP
jgi:hypothetical protein